MISPPLAGLRVLETSTGIAGPYAGRLLAMLGADVVIDDQLRAGRNRLDVGDATIVSVVPARRRSTSR
ncbi:MAG: CoA transferase [Acidimicrobiales bacterium]